MRCLFSLLLRSRWEKIVGSGAGGGGYEDFEECRGSSDMAAERKVEEER
jgi:hypothetical protein